MQRVAYDNQLPPVEADLDLIRSWGYQNGVNCRDERDLPKVNRVRSNFGLPPFEVVKHVFFAEPIARQAESPRRNPEPARPSKTIAQPNKLAPKMEIKMIEAPTEPVQMVIPPAVPGAAPPKLDRSLRGLSDAMFDALDDLRAGTGTVENVRAVADVAGRVSVLIQTQIKVYQNIDKINDADAKAGLKRLAG